MFNFQSKINKETFVLITSVFIAGLCSIIYELLISTASSYFLGDSIKQFSLTIGMYMAAMGVGSYLSRLIKTNLLSKFIALEIVLGFLGGISIPLLYLAFAHTNFYSLVMFSLIISIGILIGLEIPLLTRIMDKYYDLKINISNILSVDYFGALIATLIFPFILLPYLGTFKSSLFFGSVNMIIGFINLWCFKDKLSFKRRFVYKAGTFAVSIILIGLFIFAHFLIREWSNNLYEDKIILMKQTNYQKLVITKNKRDIRLFINGNLQFSSIDEYRYHESLVHVPFSLAKKREKILILGGGDGLVSRELLKHDSEIKEILIVDLDPEMTLISSKNHFIKELNKNSLKSEKVKIINTDAYQFLLESNDLYDLIISDLPDPNNVSLARLYSKEFYKLIKLHLSDGGIFVTQSTSPYFARKAFWCIFNTIKSAKFKNITPYHVYVPSFGDWGFIMAANYRLESEKVNINIATRYLDNRVARNLFIFEKDIVDYSPKVNTLDRPVLMNYYLDSWKHWN